ncbi:NPC intracellular cholesterol transporter 2 homolog a-like [Rhipicephalus sanguineus]|uniref:NPC intracellular cholesterol transporter 2 homolog a-like n=1 Tax=Rhipicephalus sanguineus TaxID=34632 RepID=UPI0020C3605D|nr:NPC intracellular cholesterol transporter 2 homolog a-like [Rhipicephalus sanguineus]
MADRNSAAWTPTLLGAFSVLFTASLAEATFSVVDFTSCGGDVLQVRVDPCEKLPCTFKKGRSAKIEMDFHSVNNQSSVSVGIMGKSHGVLLPLPFNQKDGCTSSGLDCPLQAGRNYTVARAVKVYRIYPKMEILAVFQVSGKGGDVLACVEFPIHIM